MAQIGYIQVIRQCNQHCIICSNPSNERSLAFNNAKKQVDILKAKGFTGVILTGGEPTLYPKLPELISYCLDKNISPRIITNGLRLADKKYLKNLYAAGLRHLHLSLFSLDKKVQSRITGNKDSLDKIKKALVNIGKFKDIKTDINIAISSYNAGHLSKTVRWVVNNYPFISHFVFNNLDPEKNRVRENPEAVPRLNDFELELYRSFKILNKNAKTFKAERVPLCYMGGYEYASTETRKIVKNESLSVYFLDERKQFNRKKWAYQKAKQCKICALDKICAGLYNPEGYLDPSELYPVFTSAEEIAGAIKRTP